MSSEAVARATTVVHMCNNAGAVSSLSVPAKINRATWDYGALPIAGIADPVKASRKCQDERP